MYESFFRTLVKPAQTKIVLLILDGLGGLPLDPLGDTELETAHTPNMDALAARSALGFSLPIGPGISVGSGPGHLAIFGYDPLEYQIGRGALEALGVDFDLHKQDLAARGNFCTLDGQGLLTDRRAGRLPTEQSQKLVQELSAIKVAGVELFLKPIKEHRFAFIMRAEGLSAQLTDTDPLKLTEAPLPVRPKTAEAERSAHLVNQFIAQAQAMLKDLSPANAIMLRGFAQLPEIPSYADMFKLRAAAIAVNGMYRGVSRLAGMEVLDLPGSSLADEFSALEANWQDYDFFYLHYKQTDTCGESGDFDGKVRAIEAFDAQLPRLLALKPDVVIITGDHSSPSLMQSHSWHPVPLLLYSKFVRADRLSTFGERSCAQGSLGIMPAKYVMPLALANAGRVSKYGA